MNQLKYYYSFKDLTGTTYTAEIWQETASVISAEEVTGDANPFIVEYPKTEPFEPIKGSGAELNLLSTTDRKFFSLYTADMMEYQIRLYKAGVLIWCGYLDSELYSEPFNSTSNYPVTFTATDGFALLERLNYLDASQAKYSGIVTQWTVIQNILNKLSLPYKNIFVGLSTTSSELTIGASETIFHKTYCNNQNWYNEDGDAETSRKVLESILQPYGAFIVQDNANVYITDINTIASATATNFKKYSNIFAYVSTTSVNLDLGDLDSIKFAASDQQMSVISGFNKQVVKYSPYIEPTILVLDAKEDFYNPAGATSNFGSSPYQWTETSYFNCTNWTRSSNGSFCSYVGANASTTNTDNTDKTDSYFKITGYATNQAIPANKSFTYTSELPIVIPSDAKLKITGKVFCRMSPDLENPDFSLDKFDAPYFLRLRGRLKIGDMQVVTDNYGAMSWISSTSTDYSKALTFNLVDIAVDADGKFVTWNKVNEKWLDIANTNNGFSNSNYVTKTDFTIPLSSGFSGGQMTFELYDWDISAYPSSGAEAAHDRIKNSIYDVRVKDLEISVVDAEGKEYPEADLEYVGYMNAKFKNEGSEITLLQGTSKTDCPTERASLMGYSSNYFYLNNWTRQGKTDCIENLLLRSIVSNYTNKRVGLTASINRIDSILGCLKYNNFLAGKNLMLVGATHNFSESITSVELQEIVIDSLEINKSW